MEATYLMGIRIAMFSYLDEIPRADRASNPALIVEIQPTQVARARPQKGSNVENDFDTQ
jgi:hypothetical protein